MNAQTTSTRELIEKFMAEKRLAMVGVSRTPADFSRSLFAELRKRGYEVVPVNPAVKDIDGIPCYARVQDITPPVKAVLLMTSPAVTEQVVQDCAEAGVSIVWMQRGAGVGSVSQKAIDFCNAHGIGVVPGHCPFMFMERVSFFHQIHTFFSKVTGGYPK